MPSFFLILLILLVFSLPQSHQQTCSNITTLKNPPIRSSTFNYTSTFDTLLQIIPRIILKDRLLLGAGDQRWVTFNLVIPLLIKRKAKLFLETGTSRFGDKECGGDGCSTILFGHLAKLIGAKLYSVDISKEFCEEARKVTKEFGDSVEIIVSDSLEFIKNFEKGLIDFLYLDSFDFDPITPLVSQMHHLQEIELAYPKIHKRTVIMIDDCLLQDMGKCKLVDEFLKGEGWAVVKSAYQIIYVHPDSL